ncbi:MAG: hypothetical protein ACYS0D_00325 [Planctomycetota bacterium]
MSTYTLHKLRDRYHVLVLFVLIALFLVAGALMWFHPFGAIAVFLLGLVVALAAALFDRMARKAEQRQAIREHAPVECLKCKGGIPLEPEADGRWRCPNCGEHLAAGTE